jgi:hypothetical protein
MPPSASASSMFGRVSSPDSTPFHTPFQNITIAAGSSFVFTFNFTPKSGGAKRARITFMYTLGNETLGTEEVNFTGVGSELGVPVFWEHIENTPEIGNIVVDGYGNIWGSNYQDVELYFYNGNSWILKGSFSGYYISAMAIAPNGDFYVVATPTGGDINCRLYKLANGGTSWDIVFEPNAPIHGIAISSFGEVYLGASNGIYIPDGNGSWELSIGDDGTYWWMEAIAPNGTLYATRYIGGEYFQIVRSTDAGNNWLTATIPTTPRYTYVDNLTVVDNNTLFAAAGGGILRSTDAGQNWERCDFTSTGAPIIDRSSGSIIYNSTTGEIFTGGLNCPYALVYYSYRSTDLGITWELKYNGLPYDWFGGSRTIFAPNTITGELYVAMYYYDDIGVNKSLFRYVSDRKITYIALEPGALDFGEVSNGNYSQKSVRIKNNSIVEYLSISSIYIDGSAFSLPSNSPNNEPITILPGASYEFTVLFSPTEDIDYYGSITVIDNANGSRNHISLRGTGTSQEISVEEPKEIPTEYTLSQNYPNPFNPTTKIQYSLPEISNVKLSVYNIMGQEVMQLVNENNQSAGKYIVDFNAQNLPSGVYFYRLQIGKFVDTKKMLLIK